MVNEGSASASEILSGAIQDNNRGILVGKKTFGKGLVQSVRGLSDGSGLTVTIAKYLTPNGDDIHKNGIMPDVIVDIPEKELETFKVEYLGTYRDTQYSIAESSLIKYIKAKKINNFIAHGWELMNWNNYLVWDEHQLSFFSVATFFFLGDFGCVPNCMPRSVSHPGFFLIQCLSLNIPGLQHLRIFFRVMI